MKKRLISCIVFEDEDIIITDPCYLEQFKGDEWNNFLDKMHSQFEDNLDFYDIIKRDMFYRLHGKKPPKRIITKPAYQDEHIMVSSTLYGDWTCSVYNCNFEELCKRIKNKDIINENDILGEFCADAGLVCVCSANHYSLPEYMLARKWTYTLIPNFNGIVSFYVIENDDEDAFLIVEGESNVNFCSYETFFD